MLPIPHPALSVVFILLAVCGSAVALVALVAMVNGFRTGGFTRGTMGGAAVFVAFAALIGFWDYLVIDTEMELHREESQIAHTVSLLEHPSTLPESLAAAATATDKQIRAAVAAHPAATAETLAALAQDKNKSVRAAVAAHPSTPTKTLKVLARDPAAAVREVIAGRGDTSPEVLAVLAADNDSEVAAAALAHPSIYPHALDAAIGRSLERLGTTPATNSSLRVAAAVHPAAGETTLRLLAADPDPAVRAAVAARSSTPPDVIAALAVDPHPDVRAAAVANKSAPDPASLE